MKTTLDEIASKNGIKITHPFKVIINGNELSFDCLIHNYGAKIGTIVDSRYEIYKKYKQELSKMGYTFSCFDVKKCSSNDDFSDMLNEWGRTNDNA